MLLFRLNFTVVCQRETINFLSLGVERVNIPMLLTVESFHGFHLFASVFVVFVPFCFLHCDKQSFSFEIFSSTAAACKTWILDAKWSKDLKSQTSLRPMLQPKTLLCAWTKHRFIFTWVSGKKLESCLRAEHLWHALQLQLSSQPCSG